MTETFNAVLARVLRRLTRSPRLFEWEVAGHLVRLAAAHNEELRSAATEIAERDAEIARIHALHNSVRSRLDEVQAAYLDYRARTEAAEARVRELENLLEQCIPYVNDGGHQQYAFGCSADGDTDFAFAKHIESILFPRT